MGVKEVYNLGIIGYGGMANYHRENLEASNTRVKIRGIFDINNACLDNARNQGYIAYSSKEELLSDPEIDMVLIATTNEVHKELSIEALKAGKHVLCEKPVTLTSDELVEIMDIAKKCNRVFTVNQNRRTNRDFVLMKRNVEAGMLGDVYVIESRVEGSRGMPSGWRTIKELGGGMMLDWGVHLIDQIMYMYPNKVSEVYCKMFSIDYPEVDDNFRLTMTFENGPVVHIEVSTNNYITHPRWYVLGKKGTLVVDDWDCEGKIIRCIDKENIWEEEIIYTKAGPTKTMAPRNSNTTETIDLHMPEDAIDSVTLVYEQLIDAIEGKAELKIKPEEALRVLKVMEAAFESAKEGIAVKTDI